MATKTFCDKCGKDCTHDNRGIKAMGDFYIYLKDSTLGSAHRTAMSCIILCLDCKTKLEKVLEDFLTAQESIKE